MEVAGKKVVVVGGGDRKCMGEGGGGEEEEERAGWVFLFFINLNYVGPTHSEKYCHISMPRQQKILFPPPHQRLTVNVGQH